MVVKIEKMTRLEKPVVVRNMQKYNERFPEENTHLNLQARNRCGVISFCKSSADKLRKTCSAEELPTGEGFAWGQQGHHFESELFFKKRLAGIESRRSSGNSMPDLPEECESDAETDNESTGYDYIRCINCSRSNSTNSLDISSSDPHLHLQIINYCYKCKHLKNPHLPAFYEGRRSSWTAGDVSGASSCYSPRRSRKSSLTDSCDLPSISEPLFDDEVNDTKELQLSVEQEVDKLTKFNASTPRRKRRSPLLTLRETNI